MFNYGEDCECCINKILCGVNGTQELYDKSFKHNDLHAIKELSKGLCINILKHEKIIDFTSYYDDKTFLHICAKHYEDTLKHPYVGAMSSNRGWTPLHTCAEIYEKTIEHPLITDSITNDKGLTPLHIYARSFNKVLEHPECGVLQSYTGYTPLHYFALAHTEIKDLELVLQQKESKKTNKGVTAQHIAMAKIKQIKNGKKEPYYGYKKIPF